MRVIWTFAIVLSIASGGIGFLCAAETDPETVLVTYHVREGKTDELVVHSSGKKLTYAQLLDKAWATYQRLGMVLDKPHLVMKGKEKGGVFMAEILRWKSHSAPDNAPAEVFALWDEMQKLCEKRGERDGIEIRETEMLRNNCYDSSAGRQ